MITLTSAMFSEGVVNVDGVRIRYVEAGAGPPVVYVHRGNGVHLSRAHELLAESNRVIAIDVPDVGPSVMRVAEQLGLERFNLWGGAAALWTAIAAPDRITALVLEAPEGIDESEPHLAEVNVPTLVIFGTRDRLTPPELGRVYRERMPNCQFVLLYDAGHEAASDRPEAFASLVGDFLERRARLGRPRTSPRRS